MVSCYCMNFFDLFLQNFYLIDPYLSTLLVLIMGRRVTYVFLNEVSDTHAALNIRY